MNVMKTFKQRHFSMIHFFPQNTPHSGCYGARDFRIASCLLHDVRVLCTFCPLSVYIYLKPWRKVSVMLLNVELLGINKSSLSI